MVKKQQRLKSKTKSNDDDEIYEEGEEGEWTDEEGNPVKSEQDLIIEPQAVPGAALSRATNVPCANPTPPTNVPVEYQGTPPTQTGLTGSTVGGTVGGVAPPVGGRPPDVAAANIFLFADPLNGAVQGPVVKPDTVRIDTGAATARAAELAGKAEFSGLTSKVDAASGRLTTRGVVTPAYSETPNLSHPSYGT